MAFDFRTSCVQLSSSFTASF